MELNPSPGVPIRAKEVLESFLRDPNTLQDFEDVIRWRLPHAIAEITFEQVSHALLWLRDVGFLVEETGADRTTRFRLDPRREAEAWKFIADPSWQPHGHAESDNLQRNQLMAAAQAWIDATLIRYLKENPSGEGDQPGLTRSRESIETLLTRSRESLGRDVHGARRAATEAARALTDALKEADNEPLATLYRALRLTLPEIQAILLCLAPELDADYQVIYGVLNDDLSRRTPTLSLISSLLGDSLKVRTALAASAGLIRWRITEPATAVLPHGDEPLRLDASLVSWLLGSPEVLFRDPVVGQSMRGSPWPGASWLNSGNDLADIERLIDRFSAAADSPKGTRWLALCGEDSDGWRAVLEAASAKANLPLARIVPVTAGPDPAAWDEACAKVVRAVLLLGAVPVLDLGSSKLEGPDLERLATLVAKLTLADHRGIVIAPELDRAISVLPHHGCDVRTRSTPSQAALASAYLTAMSESGLYLSASDAAQTASAFPLSLNGIHNAVRLASLNTSISHTFAAQASALMAACRKVASPDLPRFARRIEPTFTLADVALPSDRLNQLREIVSHVKLAGHVLNNWGFGGQLPYGRGVAALFSGPSGTGKTMAAQAIAHELGTETYVIDLSRVMSKYIGETEKFIDATFHDAQRAGAVLQIDEAEALFGRRSEVKDSHDRYANLEVAYLLQRMEAFDGVAILTTNLSQNVDQAFLRRLRFVIDFPKPRRQRAREDLAPVPAQRCAGPGHQLSFSLPTHGTDRGSHPADHGARRFCRSRGRSRGDPDAAFGERHARRTREARHGDRGARSGRVGSGTGGLRQRDGFDSDQHRNFRH